MLIERIIELQLRGPGPPGRTYTPITGYCHDKTKISKEYPRVDYYLLLKCCNRQCTLQLSDLNVEWPKSTWTENDFIMFSDRLKP